MAVPGCRHSQAIYEWRHFAHDYCYETTWGDRSVSLTTVDEFGT